MCLVEKFLESVEMLNLRPVAHPIYFKGDVRYYITAGIKGIRTYRTSLPNAAETGVIQVLLPVELILRLVPSQA